MESIPEYFEGPLVSDLLEAGGYASSSGALLGFLLGALANWTSGTDPLKVAGYGAGLAGWFVVMIILFSRVP